MITKSSVLSLAVLAGSLAAMPASAAGAPPNKAPKSDGSAGSFDARFGNGDCLSIFDTDSGNVICAAQGGYVAFTVPFTVVTWNHQTFHAFNFTDMKVEPTVHLTIVGTAPAMFLAKKDIDFAGQFIVAANAGKGGVAATRSVPAYKGGDGSSPSPNAGGHGGYGAGGATSGENCIEGFTGAGGGGGGNNNGGNPGLPGVFPLDSQAKPVHNKRGNGGSNEPIDKVYGGGGGGAGGGGDYQGLFWAYPGADGGGAVVFATNTAMTIQSTGLIDTSGHDGVSWQGTSGSSGGGAGGSQWFYARRGFTNAGTIDMHGGSGGHGTYIATCRGQVITGPNGGDGAAGYLFVSAPGFANRGLINVSTGGNGKSFSNAITVTGKVEERGRVRGILGW